VLVFFCAVIDHANVELKKMLDSRIVLVMVLIMNEVVFSVRLRSGRF